MGADKDQVRKELVAHTIHELDCLATISGGEFRLCACKLSFDGGQCGEYWVELLHADEECRRGPHQSKKGPIRVDFGDRVEIFTDNKLQDLPLHVY